MTFTHTQINDTIIQVVGKDGIWSLNIRQSRAPYKILRHVAGINDRAAADRLYAKAVVFLTAGNTFA